MPFIHSKSTQVLIGNNSLAFDLSGYLNKADNSAAVDTAAADVFGANSKAYVVGLVDGKMTMEGLFFYSSLAAQGDIETVLSSMLGQDSNAAAGDPIAFVLSSGAGGSFGDRIDVLKGIESSYDISSAITDVVKITAELQADGGGDLAAILFPIASRAATANSSVDDDGVGVAALTKGVAFSYIATARNASGTCTIKLQDSPDNITFTDVPGTTFTIAPSTPQAGRIYVAQALGRYVRATITIAMGATATLLASFSRKFA